MNRRGYSKLLWSACLVILVAATYVLISGLNTEMQQIEIMDDVSLLDRIALGINTIDDGNNIDGNNKIIDMDENGWENDYSYDTEAVADPDPDYNFDDIVEGPLDGARNPENSDVFFAEYRMQRERVRGREIELLKDLISNKEAGSEAKEEAERALLDIVDIMEKELLIENMLKAQGFDDALFFYRADNATAMLKSGSLDDRELLQVAEVVAGITGVDRETVQVFVYN